ncbi:hypothetical protein DYQ86_20935 [Acidobacteria bacterium AB60]|nr:hypothetical protein DYQ86_20935 [Acidobacteria bacterium AB60]
MGEGRRGGRAFRAALAVSFALGFVDRARDLLARAFGTTEGSCPGYEAGFAMAGWRLDELGAWAKDGAEGRAFRAAAEANFALGFLGRAGVSLRRHFRHD